MKVCTKCGEGKPLDAFSLKSKTDKARRSRCKECCRQALSAWRQTSPRHREYVDATAERTKVRKAAYYEQNRDHILSRTRATRAADPEPHRASSRGYYERNRDAVLAAQREWQRANPEKCREQASAWRAANPERRRELSRKWDQENPELRRLKESRRRARKRGAFVEDVHPLVVLERCDGECGICGGDVDPLNFHVDHILPLALGGEHSYDNVQLSHPLCNMSKGARVS